MSGGADRSRYTGWTTTLLVLLVGVAIAPAQAQELRISHQFHAEDDSRGRAARVFAAEVMRRSPGVKITIHPRLSLGLTRDEQLDALQSGTLDFAVLPFIVPSKKIPEFSLALLPGLVPDLAAARSLKGSQVQAKLQDIAAANGLRIITWWWVRGGFVLAAPRAMTTESLSGLKFQSCGLMQDLLARAGAELGDEPASEVAMLLDMGALDGAALPYEELVALRLHEHAKLAILGGPSLVTCFSPMLMSKRMWDRLSSQQRQAIDDAALVADAYFERAQIELEDRVLVAFEKAGAEVRHLTEKEFASWLALARHTVWARYRETSEVSNELLRVASALVFHIR
jgi:TRAP-type C4-dicarboxylate transport system substrate-binding protein